MRMEAKLAKCPRVRHASRAREPRGLTGCPRVRHASRAREPRGLTGSLRVRRASRWESGGVCTGNFGRVSPGVSECATRRPLPRRPGLPLGRAPRVPRAQGIRSSGLWSCSRPCLGRCRVAGPCGPALLPSCIDGPVSRTYPVRGDKGDPVSRITDNPSFDI